MANATGLILGVSGLAGAGKDTTADILVHDHDFTKVSLADPLKQIARKVYAFTDEQLWGPSQFRNAEDKRYPRADGSFLSPREALQLLGTEWGRRCYPNTWIDLCIRTAQELLTDGGVELHYTQQLGLVKRTGGRGRMRSVLGVAVPDVRFKNEMAAIKEAGGLVLRISRPGAGLGGAAALHQSEVEQASIPDSAFDRVFQNTGTTDDLRLAIQAFVREVS
jgi:hypothetical protein